MAKDKKKGSDSQNRAAPTTDPRFARLHTDPRFLKPKKDDAKVVVDERFKHLLDPGTGEGKKKSKTDKYGRKVKKGETDVDQMRRFYRLDEDEGGDQDQDEDAAEQEKPIDYARGEGELESSSEEESSEDEDDSSSEDSDDSDDDEDVMIGSSKAIQRERKRAQAAAAFDEDDEDDIYGDEIGEIDLNEDEDTNIYAELDAQAQRAIDAGEGVEDDDSDAEPIPSSSKKAKGKGKAKSSKSKKDKIPRGDDTHRLAVVNMDWDHIRAKDLYKVFSSLVSSSGPIGSSKRAGAHGVPISQVRGSLLSVRVYPSDFGKERMAKEDAEGPPREIFKGKSKAGFGQDDDDEEELDENAIVKVDEGGEFDEEALRKYQLDRLRYYYAVATFDSKQTARHVYNEIDGTEMERTANVFDLRFVPEGMEFPDGEDGRDAEFRDEATEEVVNYKGVDFRTDALRHSKVKLTWDQDDPERSKLTRMVSRGGLNKEQLRDEDFKAYLASATESEGEDEAEEVAAKGRDRLRALLELNEGKKNGGVFDDGDEKEEDENGDMEITFMPGLSEAAARKARGDKKGDDEDQTTLDKYKRKMKERKERRKAQKASQDADEDAGEGSASDEEAEEGAGGFDDPFFASDNDMDMEAALEAEFGETARSKSKKGGDKKGTKKNKISEVDPATAARERAELQLLIGDESGDERTHEGRQHFDMKDILRAESGKDAKRAKLLRRLSKKKQQQESEFLERKGKPLVQDEFEINTRDDRFSALMDDHRFAIDPSHPGFVQTKAMKKLMDERRRKLDASSDEPTFAGADASKEQKKGESDDIASLVSKLKRRAGNADAKSSPQKKKRKDLH